MPAAEPVVRFSRAESLEGNTSFLDAQVTHHRTALQYSRQGRRYRPLAAVCGQREQEIATAATRRYARAGRGPLSFDDALAALRATYPVE